MDDDLLYLNKTLGLLSTASEWEGTDELPAFLKFGTDILYVRTRYGGFLLARPHDVPSLSDTRRIQTQLARRTGLRVAVSIPFADSRQRASLVRSGTPFICPHKELFLPFVALASREHARREQGRRVAKLSSRALQATCWAIMKPGTFTLRDLRQATGMGASQASSVAAELASEGIVRRSKNGRTVLLTPLEEHDVLKDHMDVLSSPVRRIILAKCDRAIDTLPDAGEAALSRRTNLAAPAIVQKAATPRQARALGLTEVLDGELPSEETAEVQIWRYRPLFAGESEIDDVSLALSLADCPDERVAHEINRLFGWEGYQWEKAL